ncbi:hypothetical protein COO55_12810 [Rhodococcus opacus]|nr:hypothetical protein COO55_12810 [Rhodococcus opacus]
MPFCVAESDPREVSFFHYDKAFRLNDTLQTLIPIGASRLMRAVEPHTGDVAVLFEHDVVGVLSREKLNWIYFG